MMKITTIIMSEFKKKRTIINNIKTGFFPLAWVLYFCKTVVEKNGEKNTQKWGTHFFELKPGEYNIKIYFPYLFMKECGANQIQLTIVEGQTKKISFYMPPVIFLKGTIKEI